MSFIIDITFNRLHRYQASFSFWRIVLKIQYQGQREILMSTKTKRTKHINTFLGLLRYIGYDGAAKRSQPEIFDFRSPVNATSYSIGSILTRLHAFLRVGLEVKLHGDGALTSYKNTTQSTLASHKYIRYNSATMRSQPEQICFLEPDMYAACLIGVALWCDDKVIALSIMFHLCRAWFTFWCRLTGDQLTPPPRVPIKQQRRDVR